MPTRRPRWLLGATRSMVFLHRWLGIAGNLLFVVWFASALVMMYARMPALDPEDRLQRLPSLDLAAVRIGPGEAVATAGLQGEHPDGQKVRLGMAGDRPIYRIRSAAGWTSVWADTGSEMLQLSQAQATAIAQQFVGAANGSGDAWSSNRPGAASGSEADVAGDPMSAARSVVRQQATYDRLISRPDQWTLQLRPLLPAHRIHAGPDGGRVLHVSDRTAEVVMETTPASRFWGTAGAVFHWFYFTPLRTHTALWRQLIVWTSAAGCVMCLSGLAIGLLRLNRRRRSPYAGVMRWHHYTGLLFGAFAFTWVLSGLLSMDPFGWQGGRAVTRAQHAAVSDAAPDYLAAFRPEALRSSMAAAAGAAPPRELEFTSFAGEPLLLPFRPRPAYLGGERSNALRSGGPQAFLRTVQPFVNRPVDPFTGQVRRFEREELVAAAAAAMPDAEIVSVDQLSSPDAWYGDPRYGRAPLPVLRVRFDDPAATWLYLDPAQGRIVHREQRRSRVDRWLYRGLHRLDFPGFYGMRPLWDVVVIVLLMGGLFSAVTSLMPALRRLRRHAVRLTRRLIRDA